jgi:hypothetical protein
MVRAKSCAGRRPPVLCDGHEVGGVGRPRAAGEEERKWGKGGGAVVAVTILNRCAEVGDGRWGGAMHRARTERERGGPGRSADGARPVAARDR